MYTYLYMHTHISYILTLPNSSLGIHFNGTLLYNSLMFFVASSGKDQIMFQYIRILVTNYRRFLSKMSSCRKQIMLKVINVSYFWRFRKSWISAVRKDRIDHFIQRFQIFFKQESFLLNLI